MERVLQAKGIVPPASGDRREEDDLNDAPLGAGKPSHPDAAVRMEESEGSETVPIAVVKKRKAEQEPRREIKLNPVNQSILESDDMQALVTRITDLEDEVETHQEALQFCGEDHKKYQEEVAALRETLKTRQEELKTRQDKLEARQAKLKTRQDELEILKARHVAMVSQQAGLKRIKLN
ncbi:hypothetical protein HWV62_33121 [Athelia sp. TMB]|nr:hypothetical protein HWV62_33121 [Athelia sp. TMB]